MAEGKERLKFFKVNADWVARIRLADPTQSMLERASKITSVNTTGVFIETAMPFPVGSIIQVDITMPGTTTPIAVKGIVRYSNDKVGGKSPRGMALEFVKGSENMQEVITEYLKGLQKPKPEPQPKSEPTRQPKPELAPVPPPVKVEEKVDIAPAQPPQPKKEEVTAKADEELEEVLDDVASMPAKVEKKVEMPSASPLQPKKEDVAAKADEDLEEVLDEIAPEQAKPKVEEKKEEKKEDVKVPPLPAKKKKSFGEETKHWY